MHGPELETMDLKPTLTTLLCSLLGLAPGAQAQTAPPDESPAIFYETATVTARPIASAPAAVTVIDRETIEASGALTVADLLAYAPGVQLLSTGSQAGITLPQIRGADPNFTLVLLDGIPLNDPTDPQGGAVDLESLSTEGVERVEVVRGPLSHFYGSPALAGAIHIITRRGQRDAPQATAEVEGGSASLRRVAASASGGVGRAGLFASGSWGEEQGRVGDDRFEGWNAHASLDLPLLGDRADLRLTTRAAARETDDYPEGSGGPLFGSGDLRFSDHEEAGFGARLSLGAPGARHELSASVYRHTLDRESPGVFPQVPPSSESTTYTRTRLGWAAPILQRDAFRLEGGVDVEREEGDNDSTLLLPPDFGGPISGDYQITRTTPGAFAELIATRGDVALELGARVDVPEDFDAEWSPRLGLSWRPDGGPTRLRGTVGRAFKLPSFFALVSPPALGGNPDLRPETSVGGDLGIEHEIRTADLTAGLTLFFQRYRDLVDFDFERFIHLNRSRVDSRGAELTLAWRPAPAFELGSAVTWNETEDQATGDPLRHRPQWVGNARARWAPSSRLTLWTDLIAASGSRDEQIPVPGRSSVDGYELLGLAGSWRFAEDWEIRARFDNLTDEVYETLIGFPGPERSLRLSVRYTTGNP